MRLRVNGAFALMKRKFLTQSNFYAKASHQAKSYAQINGNTITIIQQISQVAIIVYGFHLFADQVITMGAIIATVILSGRALGPLAKVGQTLGRANAAFVARGNLKRFLSAARTQSDGSWVCNQEHTECCSRNKQCNSALVGNGPPTVQRP